MLFSQKRLIKVKVNIYIPNRLIWLMLLNDRSMTIVRFCEDLFTTFAELLKCFNLFTLSLKTI